MKPLVALSPLTEQQLYVLSALLSGAVLTESEQIVALRAVDTHAREISLDLLK